MTKFKVFRKLSGGGAVEFIIEANMMVVGMSGDLEFWRVTEHGKAMIHAVAPGYWITCDEVDQ